MKKACLWTAVVALSPISAAALPAQLLIDDFLDAQSVAASGGPPDSQADASAAPGALGGFRDLRVLKLFEGATGGVVRIEANPAAEDELRFSTTPTSRGLGYVRWDGGDNVGLQRDLGGLDFVIYDALELGVTFSDVGGPVGVLFARADGAAEAQATIDVPGAIPANSDQVLSLPLLDANFVTTGGTLASVLADVGAIELAIDGSERAEENWSANFDFVRLTRAQAQIPLPAPALMLLAAVGAFGAFRLRWRNA